MILIMALQACASTPEAKDDIGHKQRWYWLGSTSFGEYTFSPDPMNYWLEIDEEKLRLQADCKTGKAEANTTKAGRLWIKKITTSAETCPNGQISSVFLKQISRSNTTDQHSPVLKISLEQYGEAMFFSLDPKARLSAYVCDRGENMVQINHKEGISLWKTDEYAENKAEANSNQETNSAEGCKKIQRISN